MAFRFIMAVILSVCAAFAALAQDSGSQNEGMQGAAGAEMSGSQAGAEGVSADPEKPDTVYFDIPGSWDYYFTEPETLEKFRGEDVRKVCFADDFWKTPELYRDFTIKRRSPQRGAGRETLRYKLLTGGTDFLVVGDEAMLIRTPETGVHLIESKYCKANLSRAKFLRFRVDAGRRKADVCAQRKKPLIFLKNYGSQIIGCAVEAVHEWTGPFDAELLRSKSGAKTPPEVQPQD